MEVLIKAAQLVLSLSILVVLHELGHFIPARFFGTRVEKFYLFFDPWFSLFRFKRKDTEYGIGWLPLGGYVKISGMIDESMDKTQMQQPPQPWEFRSKKTWQRLIIMVGGVTVNVLLGIFIYALVMFAWGKEYLPSSSVKYGIACDSLALDMGLRDGDRILSVDYNTVGNFSKIPARIILDKAKSIQVDRGGTTIDIPVSSDNISKLIKSQKGFIAPRIPAEVDSILPGKPAEKAGLKKGDKIIEINGAPATFFHDVVKNLQKYKGLSVIIRVERAGQKMLIFSKVTEEGFIGFVPKSPEKFLEYQRLNFGFWESFPAGIREAYEAITMQVKQLSVLFTVKDAHRSLGGFISIGKAYDAQWDWQKFWSFTAFLSIMLAFMNILPIPALDGGHVIFLLYEIFTGKKPHEKVLEYAQYAGMILLLSLLLYANGNDIIRLVFK